MGVSLQRLQFRDVGGGNVYTVPINPDRFNPQDSDDINIRNVIDGAPVRQKSTFDERVRTLNWPALQNSNTVFTGMVSELKGFKDVLKEINLHDIDHLSLGWKRIRVQNVSTQPIQGGEFRYTLSVSYTFDEEV